MKKMNLIAFIVVLLMCTGVFAVEKSSADDATVMMEKIKTETNEIYKKMGVPREGQALTEEQMQKISKSSFVNEVATDIQVETKKIYMEFNNGSEKFSEEQYLYRAMILGYQPQQTSLTSEQEKKIVNLVNKIIIESKGKKINIDIIGYADEATGNFADNEKLRKDRSQTVASFMKNRLPEGSRVESRPSLANQNVRGTEINWRYETVKQTAVADSGIEIWKISFLVIAICFLIGGFFGWLSFRKENPVATAQNQAETAIKMRYWFLGVTTKDEQKISLRVKDDGERLSFPIVTGDFKSYEWQQFKKVAKKTIMSKNLDEVLAVVDVEDIYLKTIDKLLSEGIINETQIKKAK